MKHTKMIMNLMKSRESNIQTKKRVMQGIERDNRM